MPVDVACHFKSCSGCPEHTSNRAQQRMARTTQITTLREILVLWAITSLLGFIYFIVFVKHCI